MCLLFPAVVYAQPVNEASGGTAAEIVIYHTNDTHGYLSGDGESIIGIDTVAGLKESTPGSILVECGRRNPGPASCLADKRCGCNRADEPGRI